MDNDIYQKLIALYNEALKNDEEEKFVEAIYQILDTVDIEIRQRVYRARAAFKRKQKAPERKAAKNRWKAFISHLSPEELIEFQNTPYNELPDWIKELNPKIVQHPERNNYARIYGLVDMNEHQQEISASRLTRYMENKSFTQTYEGHHTLDYKRFSKVINEIAEKYDQSWANGLKGQKTRVTPRDIENYVESRVTPKGDKLAALSVATGMPVWYLAGYADPGIPDVGPNSSNPLESVSRFRKSTAKRKGA